MTAADILVNILLLTLLFTLGSGGALFLRRRLLRGRENVMCIIWAAVLLCAVVPFYSSHAVISFGADSDYDSVAGVSSRTEVLYVPDGADGNNRIIDAQRDIDLARKLYGENFTTVVISDGSTVDTGRPDRDGGSDDTAFTTVCILLLCVWAGISGLLITKFLIDYLAAKKLMHDHSRPYTDDYIAGIFSDCRERLGIRRNVRIRIVCEGFPCSPCVIGMFHPEIYMGGECCDYSENRLRYIFMHELCHIGRHDLLFKFCALIVTSLHWFNPLSWLIYRAVAEDCEFACDNTVLKILGRQHSDSYMFTILDIAERLCNAPQPVLANRLGSGLFMSGSPGKRFLERRYRNMKYAKTSKYSVIAAVLFILAALMVNTVVMSSCGMPVNSSPAASDGTPVNGSSGNIFLDEAIRGYYGLSDSDAITSEMIGGIETLVIRASDINSIAVAKNSMLTANTGNIIVTDAKDAVTIVDYIVNGREILSFPKKIEPRRFEENYLAVINDYYLENTTGNDSAEETLKKVKAFYCLRNYYDPTLNDADRAVMLTNFPNVDDYLEGCYMYDPYASIRETELISAYYETADLYAGFSLLGGYFDASALVALPNLVSVTYMGVMPVNEMLPAGCTSEYQEYKYNDISSGNMTQGVSKAGTASAGIPKYGDSKGEKGTVLYNGEPVTIDLSYGLFELEEKGMKTDENGIGYLVFNSKALHAAILEYFVMEYNYGNRITNEHLAQITSIEAVIRTDLDYLFGDSLALNGGHYIQFTINGETQGIIPAYYNAKEFPCGKASDLLYDAGYYELVDNGDNSYYKLVGSDENAMTDSFRQLAVIDGHKSLVTGCRDENGDGIAAFITEFSSSWDCVVARYVNGISSAQSEFELDRQYFPNLQTFAVTTK